MFKKYEIVKKILNQNLHVFKYRNLDKKKYIYTMEQYASIKFVFR